MNVYEKLNEARIKFQSDNVKKSGKNSFAGYTYYELADILPVINQIAKELKFTCVIEFGTDVATLTFVDVEKPEDKIIFTSPMSEASQKGCQPVQNLGSVETYIKRYLYQNCFEIVEADVLDMTMNPNETPSKPANNTPAKSYNTPKRTGDKEMDHLVATVVDAINHGRLKGDYLKRANQILQNPTKEDLNKLVDFLVSQEQSA